MRTLAVPCEFGDNLAFELEEQIIIGGTSSRIRKQALRDPEYDLKAMLLDGRRDEISQFQSKEIESQKFERRAEETNQIVAAKSTQKCRNCGRASHQDTVCPAKGKERNKYGKINHFARFCLSKARAPEARRQWGQLPPLPWWYGGSTGAASALFKKSFLVCPLHLKLLTSSFSKCPPLLPKDGFRDSLKTNRG